jgi:hypothetical protein
MLSPVNAELGGLPLTWRRLLMAEKSFTDTREEKLAFISPTVKAIEFGGDQSYLRELQTSAFRQHARTEEEPVRLGDRTNCSLPPDLSLGFASANAVRRNPTARSPKQLLIGL